MGVIIEKLQSNLTELATMADDPTKGKVDIALHKLEHIEEEETLRGRIDAVYKARNLVRLMVSGIEVNGERLVQFADDSLQGVESLGIEPELIRGLAKSLFEAKRPKAGETIAIAGAKRNIEIIEEIARLCVENGVNFVIDIMDDNLEAVLINNADDEGIARLGNERFNVYEGVNIKLEARSNSSAQIDPVKMKKYGIALGPYIDRLKSGTLDFSLTILPTERDAELDGMDYREYLDLFFEACDQPWEEIRAAQQILVDKFNEGKKLHITNADGTDLTMSIEGMTFANSGADVNIPGSEFFSAPVPDSINGTLVSEGNFKYTSFPIVKDITFVFENGKIVSATAKEGQETLDQILATDDGAKFIGEIAFGGNPHLRRHFVNALLVEKIGGSFHMAAGASYTFKEYEGHPVKLDNGNKSDVHWDITTMLKGKNGKVKLDDKLIHNSGVWVAEDGTPDERLAVLSKGWGALPEDRQPAWWKQKYPNGYVD